jgi:carbonic anhydrase/acetyltransferase-like protein (isoleucine patch superfamily)
MKNPIVIVGAGGLGKEIASLINDLSEFELVGFYDDVLPVGQLKLGKFPVLGTFQSLQKTNTPVSVVIASGDPEVRKKWWNAFQENKNIHFPNLIHPSALLMNSGRIQIGRGVVVFPNAVLTADITLGNNVVVHIGASVHHDVTIGDHSVIMPGARLVMSEQFDECSFVESNYFKPHSF